VKVFTRQSQQRTGEQRTMAPRGKQKKGDASQASTSPSEQEQLEQQEQKSTQEILALGQSASDLLGSPIFNTMYNLRLQEAFAEWLNSEPKEEKRRESLYYECKGLVDLTNRMEGLVQEANTLLAEQAEKQDPEYQQNEYLDEQGFGLTQ
jgi:hypothetical protein